MRSVHAQFASRGLVRGACQRRIGCILKPLRRTPRLLLITHQVQYLSIRSTSEDSCQLAWWHNAANKEQVPVSLYSVRLDNLDNDSSVIYIHPSTIAQAPTSGFSMHNNSLSSSLHRRPHNIDPDSFSGTGINPRMGEAMSILDIVVCTYYIAAGDRRACRMRVTVYPRDSAGISRGFWIPSRSDHVSGTYSADYS